ncbi:MAG: hypothetical protein K2X47_09570 [Bdellovibrionales bacterium]|nr:hypothetical protein [Bdellovibrionales bacterium]
MRNLRLVLVAAVPLVLAIGCGTKPQFSVDQQSTSFGQQYTFNNKIDVLWVMDQSDSMMIHRTNLANQIGSFVDILVQKKMDFQMAVTTMNMGSSGEKGAFIGSPKVISGLAPNVKNLFAQTILTGTSGVALSRGLDAMKAALQPGLLSGANQGFLRSDAKLVIIFISDDNDRSSGTPVEFMQFLDNTRPPFPFGVRGWTANFIGITDPQKCTTGGMAPNVGDRFIAMARETNGASENLCSPTLVQALENIRSRLVDQITEFRLDRDPVVDSIQVSINGVSIPNSIENGWTFEAEGRVLRFHGSAVPPADAEVRIAYQPVGSR